MRANGMQKARCPYCGAPIELRSTIREWDMLICHVCDTPLQVVELDPPELDYAWNEDLALEMNAEDAEIEEDEFDYDELELEEMLDDWDADGWDDDDDWDADDDY